MSRENNDDSPKGNLADARFWARLRRGDYGLPKTFWLAWFIPVWLLGFAIEVATTIMVRLADTTTELVVAFAAALIQMGIYLTYYTLSSIWTWRAARKHPNRWALVAKIVIGMHSGTLVVSVTVLVLVPILGIPVE